VATRVFSEEELERLRGFGEVMREEAGISTGPRLARRGAVRSPRHRVQPAAGGRGRGFGVDAVGFLDAGFGLVDDVVTQNGERTWYRYRDVVLDDGDFGQIGAALEAAGTPGVQQAQIDAATCRLLPLQDAVEFARDWMIKNRERSSS
jgi:hypothetical protein